MREADSVIFPLIRPANVQLNNAALVEKFKPTTNLEQVKNQKFEFEF